ncbi:intermediate conductance calcium-activated potassium channel protein 4 [Bufo bufo]|uniref:intermediate conductance calcium-activated potassium channel protein 4 n=1 Tax=Bufo bufo TaxID=8384 RepID=UPI001ABE54D3|nr:intermediate conductance calcium-activated potassium channel protein 4 [Bufo bufo]
MGRSGWPLFTTCLPASRGRSARSDMQTKELTEISILSAKPKVDILREPASEKLRKLKKRKVLVEQKKRLSAWILFLALLGILLMVIHTELLCYANCQWFVYLYLMKCTISISTIILLILIITFHVKEIKLFMTDNSLVHWRIAVNTKKMVWILLEIMVCAIHPFPYAQRCNEMEVPNSEKQSLIFLSQADIFLSILMFLRVYLLPRTVLLHSKVLANASYRSIGALNKIKFQYQFVIKILMNTCPGRVLLILTISLWVVASWVLSVCERDTQGTANLTSSMWLIPITFLTIGYGDMVPDTICGKMVCLVTGVMGVGCTALIVAVAAQKLEFTKAEKHVHNFMMDIHYMKQIKGAAANVLGEAWLLHRHTKQGDMAKIRLHQRELLAAIHIFRRRRRKHKNLKDEVNAMVDISKMQMIMTDLDCNFTSSHQDLEKRIDQLDKKLDEISRLILTAIESPQLSH